MITLKVISAYLVAAASLYLAPIPGAAGVRQVVLLVHPPAVERGQTATLHCQYDLEGAPLYTIKWYRGNREFYRYSPKDVPPTKIFPYYGIHVDLSLSNASQVVLRQVGFNLSGNISCEVTTDAPSFSTAMASRQMMVVELPVVGPTIEAEGSRYDVGDTLRANCTSPPAKPPAALTFQLNGIPVASPGSTIMAPDKVLQWSFLPLELELEPFHFTKGQLILKCTALVSTLYRETSEINLGPSRRTSEPVPERVRSWSGGVTPQPVWGLGCLIAGVVFSMAAR